MGECESESIAWVFFADFFCQDVYSYNREQEKGHESSNVITVLTRTHRMSLQGAADYVGAQFKLEVDKFIANKAHLPSWGPVVDADVAVCVEGLENWVTGIVRFTCASDRYTTAKERATGVVTLRKPEGTKLQLLSHLWHYEGGSPSVRFALTWVVCSLAIGTVCWVQYLILFHLILEFWSFFRHFIFFGTMY